MEEVCVKQRALYLGILEPHCVYRGVPLESVRISKDPHNCVFWLKDNKGQKTGCILGKGGGSWYICHRLGFCPLYLSRLME